MWPAFENHFRYPRNSYCKLSCPHYVLTYLYLLWSIPLNHDCQQRHCKEVAWPGWLFLPRPCLIFLSPLVECIGSSFWRCFEHLVFYKASVLEVLTLTVFDWSEHRSYRIHALNNTDEFLHNKCNEAADFRKSLTFDASAFEDFICSLLQLPFHKSIPPIQNVRWNQSWHSTLATLRNGFSLPAN